MTGSDSACLPNVSQENKPFRFRQSQLAIDMGGRHQLKQGDRQHKPDNACSDPLSRAVGRVRLGRPWTFMVMVERVS